MIRRVYVKNNGMIVLDSDLYGKRIRLSTGQKSSKNAINYFEKNFDTEFTKLYDQSYGNKRDGSQLTFHEYGKYVLSISDRDRNQFTQNKHIQVFNKLSETFGKKRLSDISADDVLEWQNTSPFAPRTIKNYRETFNFIMQRAVDNDLIRKNPVKLTKAPRQKMLKELVFYEEEDMKKIINAAQGQLKNYIQLCFFSGMRGSEMIALRWDDIDFVKDEIRVDSRIRSGNEDVTKSKKVRFIPIFTQSREALLRQHKLTAHQDFIFLTQYGQHYATPKDLSGGFRDLTVKLGLQKGTGHDMRRSFNTLLKQLEYPEDWILKVIGHMDIAVNQKHYTGSLKVDTSKINSIEI